MRKAISLLSVSLILILAGCASTDPITLNNLRGLKAGHIEMMDDRDALAVKAGEPKLDDDFRASEAGKYDDAIDYEVSKSK